MVPTNDGALREMRWQVAESGQGEAVLMRKRLSDTPEEEAFLRADEACDKCAAAMKASILGRMQAAGAALHRPSLAMALAYAAPSAIRLAFKPPEHAHAWATEMLAAEQSSQKAGPKVLSESEIIDEAVDAGIELGLDTLPAKIRGKVDVGAAKKLARKRLLAGMFRQNVAAYEESLRGLEKLASAARLPSMATLVDIERLASMFGLTSRQAAAIVRATEALFNYGPKNTKARLESIRRAMVRQIQTALEARAEVLGQTIGREAISTGQQALFETAQRQGLLDEEKQKREWVTRHDEKVCPICDSVDGVVADIDQSFEAEDGSILFQPPAHPRCRCSIRLVTVKTPKRATRRRAA